MNAVNGPIASVPAPFFVHQREKRYEGPSADVSITELQLSCYKLCLGPHVINPVGTIEFKFGKADTTTAVSLVMGGSARTD